MENVSFIKYLPQDKNHLITAQLVECYREVFADSPWHEWLKCPKCGQYWGVKDQTILVSQGYRHCGVSLVDFWSREQVICDLYHEINKDSSCWLAIGFDKVVGFCWGYPATLNDLEKKLEVSFTNEFERAFGFQSQVAYQDEVGVITSYRGKKIAKMMVLYRLNDFIKQGLKVGVVRTRQFPEPSQTFLWYKNLGYEVLAEYEDGRVIMCRELLGLSNKLS
jgi:ribosomal protein S18 acetylase RimI-like enzyme